MKGFGCFVMIKLLERSFMIVRKKNQYLLKSIFDRWMDHSKFHRLSVEHTLNDEFFWLSVISWGTHLSRFFTLPPFSRWTDIVEMMIRFIKDISLTLFWGLSTVSVFRCWLGIADGRLLTFGCSRFVFYRRTFSNQCPTNQS